MTSSIQPHPARVVALAAALILMIMVPGNTAAQPRDETGLTGNPLVDSILQAPGPDFLAPRGARDDARVWDAPRRDRASERWDDPMPRSEPRDRADDIQEPFRGLQELDPDTQPTRQARRTPPPPPAPRGDGPLDVIILDAEPRISQPQIIDAPDATPPEAPQIVEAPQTPSGPPADQEEPFREQAETDPGDGEADQVAAVAQPAATPSPATPDRAPAAAAPDPELNRMIGQMIMVGFPGMTPTDEGVRRVAEQLEAGKAGGVILMSRNIETPRQLKQLTRALTRAGQGKSTPFIAVDQEGGFVQRLSRVKGFKTHPSAERLGARNNPQAAYSAYRNLALELREYGFNLNLGPVVDLNLNPENPVIGRLRRAYSADPDQVTAYAKAFVHAHNETGILTAAKHFPGHGSSATDSHDVLVDVSKSWQERELRPYRKLIEDQAIDMIMIGHLYHPAFSDSPDTPASLSPRAIESVLRDSLNFDGVVITDDLDMRGVRQNAGFEARIVGAIAAGNDILLITNTDGYKPDLPDRVAEVIRAAIADGRLSEDRIRRSYERIIALKEELAQLQRTATSAGEDRGLEYYISDG